MKYNTEIQFFFIFAFFVIQNIGNMVNFYLFSNLICTFVSSFFIVGANRPSPRLA